MKFNVRLLGQSNIVNFKMDQLYYRKNLIKLFLKSVAAVSAERLILENLKVEKNKLHVCHEVYDIADKNIYVIGFGKAVLGMAAQCEKILGKYLKSGVICSPQCSNFSLISDFSLKEGSVFKIYKGAENNIPDKNAEKGTSEIISLVETLDSINDHLIVLISGGGSALFTKPKPNITLAEKRETIKLLMESGADINELNTVRKKLSSVKGGGLAVLSYPVLTSCLIISDVINDPIDVIASGPTVPPSDSDLTAFNVLQKFNLENKVPKSVLKEIKKPSQKLDVPILGNEFPHVKNFIIGNNTKALEAMKKYAEVLGFQAVILSNQIKGTVHIISDFYVNIILQILTGLFEKSEHLIKKDDLFKAVGFNINSKVLEEITNLINLPSDKKNICIIAGGEPTVEVKGDGKGGRNQELALLTSVKLGDLKNKYPHLFSKYEVVFLFAGTDGQDGPTDAAGALGDSYILQAAEKNNLDVYEFLSRNDSYNFFSKIDSGSYLIKTGHTGTNVMDVHALLIYDKN